MKVPRAAGNGAIAPNLKTPATAGVYFFAPYAASLLWQVYRVESLLRLLYMSDLSRAERLRVLNEIKQQFDILKKFAA